jgi:carboxymethylenebutenolidase
MADPLDPTAATSPAFNRTVFVGLNAGAVSTATDTFAYTAQISTPIRGNYGERARRIAAADVRAMFATLAVPHELRIYPAAGHAFFDDTRASYVTTAAADAWTKTLAWFGPYLT